MDLSEELRRLNNYLGSARTALATLTRFPQTPESTSAITELNDSLEGIQTYVDAIEQKIGA